MPKFAFQTKFSWNNYDVAQLDNVGGVNLSSESIDVTTHDGEDRYRKFTQGLIDAGEVAISGYFSLSDTNGQVAMLTDFNAGETRDCAIKLPGNVASWAFPGFLTAFAMGESAVDGVIPFSATVKIAGKPTLSITASTGLTTPFFVISNDAILTPAAAGDVYDYVATVLTGVSSVTVTPTATAGVIKVNGNVVATGQASSAIALGSAGSITIITIEVAETGKVPKKYTIRVSRA
jgi:predicted secreted protein